MKQSLLILFAMFPLVYYFVSYQPHYPAAMAWLLLLLAGFEVQSWIRDGSNSSPLDGRREAGRPG